MKPEPKKEIAKPIPKKSVSKKLKTAKGIKKSPVKSLKKISKPKNSLIKSKISKI